MKPCDFVRADYRRLVAYYYYSTSNNSEYVLEGGSHAARMQIHLPRDFPGGGSPATITVRVVLILRE
jgi:hypothetical protein